MLCSFCFCVFLFHFSTKKAAERADFKLVVIVYKCLHGVAPSYLADELCSSADFSARHRSVSSSSLVVRCTRLYNHRRQSCTRRRRGVSRIQLTSTVNGENPGSRPPWSMHTSWTTPKSDKGALLFLDNNGLSWTVSARTRSLRCLWEEMESFRLRSVFLRWDPNDVTHCRILPTDKTTRWLV